MKRLVNLSYRIDEKTPLYPGTPSVIVRRVKKIGGSHPCNTSMLCLSNHAGTHMDAPRHFFNSGKAIGDYSDQELRFRRPLIIDCPKGPDEGIGVDDIRGMITGRRPDALLIRTGFSRFRQKNTSAYRSRNPYILPQCAAWLREEHPGITALGIDCISIASYAHRDEGRQAHRTLLAVTKRTGKAILLIEGMCIPPGLRKLTELIVIPLFDCCPDGAPCSVIGMYDD